MNKAKKFWKSFPRKLYLLLAAILAFAFFSNDFGLVDIQKTAIILAAGVDKEGETYSVTTLIAAPKGTDPTTGGTSSVSITGEGKTVSDGIAQIYAKTGWVPKLVFCDLVLLGESVINDGTCPALDYFLRNEYMSDSCLVAACVGKASDILSSQSALDDASSLAISKLFTDSAEKSGLMRRNTLREYTISRYGAAQSGYLPLVTMMEQEGSGGSNQGQSASFVECAGSEGDAQSQKEQVYEATQTALMDGGKYVGKLTKEQTFAFNLIEGKIFAGTLETKTDDKPVSVSIVKNSGGVSLDMKGAPKAKISVKVRVRVVNKCGSETMKEEAETDCTDEMLKSVEEKILEDLTSLWDTIVQCDCDLFELKRDLYRSSKKKYEEWEPTLLSVVTPEFDVEVKCAQ